MTRKLFWAVCVVATACVWFRCAGENPTTKDKDTAALTDEERRAGEAYDAQDREAPLKKTGADTYALDGITINTKTKQIRFAATVNQVEQDLPLEVLVCTDYGKTHEALLRTKVSPTNLNVAFKLLGCHGGKPREGVGSPEIPVGSAVEIEIKWTNPAGKVETIEPESWIWNHQKKAPMEPTVWTYTGSVFHTGKFMAQQTGTIINLYTDPSTLVEPPVAEVTDDTAFGVHQKAVPPVGTKVEIIITALPEKKEGKTKPETKSAD